MNKFGIEYSPEVGEAGYQYIRSKAFGNQTNLPAKFRWVELFHVMLEAASASAQEDEPVYLVFNNSTCYDGSWEFANKDEFDKAGEDARCKLYTRPDNSTLRKAAEEALQVLEDYYASETEIADAGKALRTALREAK